MAAWELEYGNTGRFAFDLPEERLVAAHRSPRPLADVGQSIAEALAQPIAFPPLEHCVFPGDRIVLVLDRHTPCGDALVAETWSVLQRRQIEPEDVTILQPADFRGRSPEDPRKALPESDRDRLTWTVHDPTVRGSCTYLASTASGERVYLSRQLLDADVVVSLGSMSFDPVLGYRGTHSAFYPGLSDVEALRRSQGQGHDELTADDPRPLRQLIDEVAWLLGAQFSVQVIPSSGTGIADVIAGQAESVLARGKELLIEKWRMDVAQRPELVVAAIDADASGHSWNQLACALDTARQLVARDGRVLLLTELIEPPSEGIRLISDSRSPRDALKPLRNAAPPDLVSATQIARAIDWTNVYLLSRLDPQLVEDLFMIPLASDAEARRLLEGDELCAVVAGAHHTAVRHLNGS